MMLAPALFFLYRGEGTGSPKVLLHPRARLRPHHHPQDRPQPPCHWSSSTSPSASFTSSSSLMATRSPSPTSTNPCHRRT
ncbi:uncharacterized protein ACA1_371750 [Acanthamoeba castellanii str. Neff]|uniref:Uncharacterized protein n=1 Tax=Acanthamoeba castellanii (strain ATCC 30010 / Neff) TaxID=1257118 RepID=L8GZ95_ACACF|nr:uncharacterized protein ACA1_371750 [Acanthamoeba castellanii str. Neff]ELR18325.1 hypothetical protein ACA1_371750 [Acanthamoeba castellanii str. Neff]